MDWAELTISGQIYPVRYAYVNMILRLIWLMSSADLRTSTGTRRYAGEEAEGGLVSVWHTKPGDSGDAGQSRHQSSAGPLLDGRAQDDRNQMMRFKIQQRFERKLRSQTGQKGPRCKAREKSTSGGVLSQYVGARRSSATKQMGLFQRSDRLELNIGMTCRVNSSTDRRDSLRDRSPKANCPTR